MPTLEKIESDPRFQAAITNPPPLPTPEATGSPPEPVKPRPLLPLPKAEEALQRAREALAALERQLEEHTEVGHVLSAERERIAYSAHTGDDKAAERLQSIHSASIHYESEKQSILAAIAEGRRRRATAAD